jgi:hypothetical protein
MGDSTQKLTTSHEAQFHLRFQVFYFILKKAENILMVPVTIMNGLSASGHVHDVIQSSAQTQYALWILRARGINNTALQAIFRSTVIVDL